jgi:hypothetical protein
VVAPEPSDLPSWLGVIPTIWPTFASCGTSASATTAATTATLATAFPDSNTIRGPNTFLIPVAGLMRLMSGLIAPSEGRMPTCAMFAISPAAMHTAAIGATVASITCIPVSNRPWRPAAVAIACGRAISWNIALIAWPASLTIVGASDEIAIRPAISTSAPLKSVLLATWPFFRASVRRFGVAFSVLSAFAIGAQPICSAWSPSPT